MRIGADPLGGASVHYWGEIADRHGLDLTVVNPLVDATWRFMTLDWDGKIRMDCSSPSAMACLVAQKDRYDVATGNDADADRHGIVTPDAGLMNPNHYLAVAIQLPVRRGAGRPGWPSTARIGKTLVSSSMIDRVAAALGKPMVEVPVGFKWFVPGLIDGSFGFGGEESAGASFLRMDGSTWTTDKDGLILCLLAGRDHREDRQDAERALRRPGRPARRPGVRPHRRPGQPRGEGQLGALSPEAVTATELAGEPITAKLTEAPGNGAKIGGLKVTTESAWFAARPSGTEDVYKIYAESFRGPEHLAQVQAEAKASWTPPWRGSQRWSGTIRASGSAAAARPRARPSPGRLVPQAPLRLIPFTLSRSRASRSSTAALIWASVNIGRVPIATSTSGSDTRTGSSWSPSPSSSWNRW